MHIRSFYAGRQVIKRLISESLGSFLAAIAFRCLKEGRRETEKETFSQMKPTFQSARLRVESETYSFLCLFLLTARSLAGRRFLPRRASSAPSCRGKREDQREEPWSTWATWRRRSRAPSWRCWGGTPSWRRQRRTESGRQESRGGLPAGDLCQAGECLLLSRQPSGPWVKASVCCCCCCC